jgi:hypothetical protein
VGDVTMQAQPGRQPKSSMYYLFIFVSFIISLVLSYFVSDIKLIHFGMINLFAFFLFFFLGIGVLLLGRIFQKKILTILPNVIFIWIIGAIFLVFGMDWRILH